MPSIDVTSRSSNSCSRMGNTIAYISASTNRTFARGGMGAFLGNRRGSDDVNEALYAAVEQGSLAMLNEAIAAGADLNYLNTTKKLPGWSDKMHAGTGNSALHLAIACWRVGTSRAIIDRLIESGANVQQKSKPDGYTCLFTAVYSGNIELLSMLIDRGCNVNDKDNKGFIALHRASYLGHRDVVEFLLNRGSNINEKYHDESTSLHEAAHQGHREVVQLLLHRGINVDEKNIAGYTSLHWAVSKGHIEIADLLIQKGANPHLVTNNGANCLHWAASNNHKEIVKFLLVVGINSHQKTITGSTPRKWAAHYGNYDIEDLLQSWPTTMLLIVLQDLLVLDDLDPSIFIDMMEYF